MAIISAYDAFNARNLTLEQVGKTFISLEQFSELWGGSHALLLGPRGSGKTTLIKMLTLPALKSWPGDEAKIVLDNKSFDAVYVPADVHWQQQLLALDHSLGDEAEGQFFSSAAVTANVLYSLVQSFEWRLEDEQADEEVSTRLAKELIAAWHMSPCVPMLPAVRSKLITKLSDLAIDAKRASFKSPDDLLAGAFAYLDYLQAARAGCEAFDSVTGGKRKWALCFDEVELAPGWLQARLFQELRSTDERFLFKVSTSPLPELLATSTASERDDFTFIRLWPHRKQERAGFAQRLTAAVLRERFGRDVDPEALLGRSPIARETGAAEYTKGSQTWKRFQQWARKDERFVEILTKHGIDLATPDPQGIQKRDQVLRKAKPIVIMRTEFAKGTSQEGFRRRSRKVPPIYYGVDTLYDISDGNPRWLRALLRELLDRADPTATPPMVPYREQAKVFFEGARQFAAKVETLPDSHAEEAGVRWSLTAILNQAANYFFERLVLGDFTLDPPGTFVVDEEVPSAVLPLLRNGVYHGVLILVDPPGTAGDFTIRGKRLRIAYMLAPLFRLPLRQYDPVRLSTILGDTASEGSGSEQLFMSYLYETQ